MAEVRFVDTTLRDGHASLWAEEMTTGMMLPVASRMDEAGFASMELIATSHFKKCVRELREDPWERIRLVAQRVRRTPLTLMMLHSVTSFDLTPFSILKLFIDRIAAAGIGQIQVMDAANDMRFRIPECVAFARAAGMRVSLPLIYSHSPKHSDEYYAQKTRDAAALAPDVIYLKDSGGLLTPERTPGLLRAMLAASGGIPVELHSHCTTGLAPLCYLEAVEAGVTTLHTAIPPLANGASQPSLFNIAGNLRLLGHTPAVDDAGLQPVAAHFHEIARREGLPVGAPLEYDTYQYVHQVPGGVISNLKHQLAKMGMAHRLEEVFAEIVQVKRDLGYPIMVTPFSQFVASQAAIHVMTGQRYRQVTDEVIQYTLGFWGKEASAAVDPEVADRITSLPRAKELARWEPPQPSVEEVRRQFGGPSTSDDELILRYIVRDETQIQAMRAAGPAREYASAAGGLVQLIESLLRRGDLDQLYLEKGDVRLTMGRQPTECRTSFDSTR